MPTVEVPASETTTLLTGCAGETFAVEVEGPAGAQVRLATSPSVVEGETVKEGRTVDVTVPEGADNVYAKAYQTNGNPATVYVNQREGPGLAVDRQSPTVIDRIREDLSVEASSSALYDKFQTFEFTGNYSHQVAPSWDFMAELGITIVSGEMGIEITAGDGDSDQMAIDSPMTFDQTEFTSVKFHDTQNSNPRVVGWVSGVDT